MDGIWHGCKAFVFGQALIVAVINLLNDYGKFETRERDIKCESVKDRFRFFLFRA